MKLNVGDYVRTDIREIRKVVRVTDDLYVLDKDVVFAHKDKIKKSSPNIIDLIEVRDYVNGLQINEITEKDEKHPNRVCWNLTTYGDDDVGFTNNYIKTVVTKEQFEQMEYKIGGNDDSKS